MPDNWVLRGLGIVTIVLVWGLHMIIEYLDPQGSKRLAGRFAGLLFRLRDLIYVTLLGDPY